DFLTCLPIEQARGNVGQSFNLLANLGLVSRYRGEYTKALEYYEQGIEICKRMNYTDAYASILGNMSSVYRRQGRIDEALSHAKVAWRIRQELFAQGKIDEVSVGLTLHLLGQAYLEAGKYNEAERSFDRVYDIYLRNNYKIGFPVVFNRYGQLNLSSGKLEVAQEWFKRAVELSEGVNSEQYINSLNRLGRICLKREQWREAIALFEQAIAAAVPVPDYYQQVENKLDLADAVSRIGDYEKSQQLFAEAEAMARVENYVQFLAQVEQRQAELEYRRGEYHEAFRHYALYCQRLAEYNHTAFIAAVQYIVDVLLDIPRSQVAQVVQDLKSYWTELQLNEKYPELVQAIEEIDSLMLP
ncbi:MAG TPA: tetratricopeptide repeat protein, partial [Ktedonobacteraceae bacterium]|nr:tetratricopeptide repeat protein [Ktedonobacteraceae bacterium]